MDSDAVEALRADLIALRREHGNLGYKSLGRRMGLSHTTIHTALNREGTVPSEHVLTRMIEHWAPHDLDGWLSRRREIVAPKKPEPAGDPPATSTPGPAPGPSHSPGEPHRRAWRGPLVALLALCIGVLGATPVPAGGVDVHSYCVENYPEQVSSPPAAAGDGRWADWRCLLEDGVEVPVDIQRACRQQHPPLTPLGRSFADHLSEGSTSWRCYTAQFHFPLARPRG